MVVYKPVFTSKWEVEKLNADLLKHVTQDTVAYYRERVGFYGVLYNADNIFKTEEDAWKWINKEYVDRDAYYTVGK